MDKMKKQNIVKLMNDMAAKGSNMNFELHDTFKNNQVLCGILCKYEDSNPAPMLYFDENDTRNEFEIAVDMLIMARNAYKHSEFAEKIKVQIETYQPDIIRARLINKEMNRERLKKIPYREFLDLAIIYAYNFPLDDSTNEIASVIITNEMLKNYNITEEDLYKDSMRKMNAKVIPLHQLIKDLLGDNFPYSNFEQIEERAKEFPMYVIMNNDINNYGAIHLTNVKILQAMSEKFDDDIIILPSSIHEIIVLPKRNIESVEEIRSMVREINLSDAIMDSDILSDNVYVYYKNMNTVTLIPDLSKL